MKPFSFFISGITLSVILFSCEKTDIPASKNLEMDIESCKPKDKKNLYVGMEYQGGIIFYLDETGKHGLISAKEDLGPAPWGCYGTSIPAAQGGDGLTNTLAILANCPEPGIAARLCDGYIVREKGDHGKKYDDWFMPSFGQFTSILYFLKSASGLCQKSYWVSSEAYGDFKGIPIDPKKQAWEINCQCAIPNPDINGIFPRPAGKSGNNLVRPIRAF